MQTGKYSDVRLMEVSHPAENGAEYIGNVVSLSLTAHNSSQCSGYENTQTEILGVIDAVEGHGRRTDSKLLLATLSQYGLSLSLRARRTLIPMYPLMPL